MIKVNEIFNSISGEVSPYYQGRLATFVRFSGCCAECRWCDTKHDAPFTSYSRFEFLKMVQYAMIETFHLCITGGEPLLQPDAVNDLILIYKNSWIETSGLVNFKPFIGKTSLVVDYKLEVQMKKGFSSEVILEDYLALTQRDFIKFIIGSKKDFDKFKEVHTFLYRNGNKATIAVSPVHNVVSPKQLVEWVYRENINEVVLNVQLHKIIGLP